MYKNIKDILSLKLQAKRLYIIEGKKGKEISQALGVSENSICKWIKDNDWKTAKIQNIEMMLTCSNDAETVKALDDFKAYLKLTKPYLYQLVEPTINEFLNLNR